MIWLVRIGFAVAILALLVLAFRSSFRPPDAPTTLAAGGEATQAPVATVPAAPMTAGQMATLLPTATIQTVVSRMARTTLTLPSQPTAASNQPPAITISDAGFAPSELRIGVGTTITWRNEGLQSHDVSMVGQDRSTWGSGLIAPNGRTSRTFSLAGQFDYTCSLHTVMRGRIVVVR